MNPIAERTKTPIVKRLRRLEFAQSMRRVRDLIDYLGGIRSR